MKKVEYRKGKYGDSVVIPFGGCEYQIPVFSAQKLAEDIINAIERNKAIERGTGTHVHLDIRVTPCRCIDCAD